MAIKENFEYESLHDPQSVADYIKAIRKGIAARSIRFTSGDDEMEMQPSDLLTLSVRARKKGGENQIIIKLLWKDKSVSGDSDKNKLSVKS
jgi:amphi-Trp domain-containing protein